MKQVVQNYKTGELKLEEVPIPSLKPGGVLVRNRYSLVSVGTEKSMTELAQKSIIGKAKQRPDLVKQVIAKAKKDGIANTINVVRNKLDVVKPLGYSSSGIVVEVGRNVDEFQPGDRVSCAGAGYASHADSVFVPKNLCVKMPGNVSFENGACGTIGAVALQGVRVANPLLGEKVAVIGLGLVGQITVQILRSSGCAVLGFDMDSSRVELAIGLGLDVGVSDVNDIENAAKSISRGYGIDAIIITASTQSSTPVEIAAGIARDKACVVVVGNVGMNLSRELFYRKELDLRFSRSYGPGRYDPVYEEKGIDYPFGYVRWTENRNIETFLDLVSQDKIEITPLITHCFPLEKASTIYGLLNGKVSITDVDVVKHKRVQNDENDGEAENRLLGVLIEYEEDTEIKCKLKIKDLTPSDPKSSTENHKSINVGLIGAGNFVKSTLLPILKSNSLLRLKGLATATGINAKISAEKHGFEYCTTNYNEIFDDNDIDLLLVATRHDLHAKLVIEALQKKKDVFVEKPLAIYEEDLNKIIDVWQNSKQRLMVGFNRRFSPFAVKIKEFFANRKEPLAINYRINAGFIPKDSWVHESDEGGGRVIGEVCHFVDLLQYFAGVQPLKVYAELMPNYNHYSNDNVNVSIKFKDGSIGFITYLSCGDKAFPKERVEIFGEGSVAVIDDFKSAFLTRNGKIKRIKGYHHDKGHRAEIEEFVSAVCKEKDCPIPFSESVMVTITTFKILESIREGKPVTLNIDD